VRCLINLRRIDGVRDIPNTVCYVINIQRACDVIVNDAVQYILILLK
jgi:hypothetical protein